MTRPSTAIIDLDALKANYRLACELSLHGRVDARTLAVVKANAYGHGAVQAARTLEPLAPALAVACCDEAMALREAGIRKPVLLLEGFFSNEEIHLCADHNLWPMIGDPTQVEALLKARPTAPLRVWIKVDTGMHRLGITLQDFPRVRQQLESCAHIQQPLVAATHFACADEPDNPFTAVQIDRLRSVAPTLPLSMANSPALLAWPDARADWNRPGFMLYGSSPFDQPLGEAERLRPVMHFQSRVMAVREIEPGEAVGYGETWRAQRTSVIATIPVGYGDGYPRTASNGTPVLVNGKRAPLAGRVSMDLITVDVTDVGAVKPGDPVELWGANLSVNEVASHAASSPYEVLTRIPARLRREYRGGADSSPPQGQPRV